MLPIRASLDSGVASGDRGDDVDDDDDDVDDDDDDDDDGLNNQENETRFFNPSRKFLSWV